MEKFEKDITKEVFNKMRREKEIKILSKNLENHKKEIEEGKRLIKGLRHIIYKTKLYGWYSRDIKLEIESLLENKK